MPDGTNTSFQVHANSQSGTMRISLARDGADLGSLEIATKTASSVAAVVLGAAKRSHEVSGKSPLDPKEEAVSFTTARPSGWHVSRNRTSNSTTLLFHFGEAVLGMELPESHAQLLGRRLTTTAEAFEAGPSDRPPPSDVSEPQDSTVAPVTALDRPQQEVWRSPRDAPPQPPLQRPIPRGLLVACGCFALLAATALSREIGRRYLEEPR
jgi:hypothetical protein